MAESTDSVTAKGKRVGDCRSGMTPVLSLNRNRTDNHQQNNKTLPHTYLDFKILFLLGTFTSAITASAFHVIIADATLGFSDAGLQFTYAVTDIQ